MRCLLVAIALLPSCGLVRDLQNPPPRPTNKPEPAPVAQWKPRTVVDTLPGYTGRFDRSTDQPHRIAEAFENADNSMLAVYAPTSGRAGSWKAQNVGTKATLPCNANLTFNHRGLYLHQAELPEFEIAPNTLVLVWSDDGRDAMKVMTPDARLLEVDPSNLAPRTQNPIIVSNGPCTIPFFDTELRPADPAAYVRMTSAKKKVDDCVASVMKPAEAKVDKMRLRHAYVDGHLRPQYDAQQLQAVVDSGWKRAQARCSTFVPAAKEATRVMLMAWELYRRAQLARIVAATEPRATRVAQP
ncbi:MAG: hypothetical protein ACKV2T_10915 [Kofleriaceae bacterium]